MTSPSSLKDRPFRQFNGIGLLLAMLREVDPKFRLELLKRIRQFSPIIARLADHSEFIFSDIKRLDDRGIQKIFDIVPEKDWLIAWKLADEPTRAFLLRNMSERKRKDFLESFATQPKVLKRRVIAVQSAIAQKIHALLGQGKLGLRSKRLRDRIPG